MGVESGLGAAADTPSLLEDSVEGLLDSLGLQYSDSGLARVDRGFPKSNRELLGLGCGHHGSS